MRKMILTAFTALAFAAAAFQPQAAFAETPVAAQAESVQRTLEVTGRATVKAKPDTAMITLGVNLLEKTPDAAYSAVGDKMASVASALKAMGLKEDDMKTGMLYLSAEYDWLKEGGQVLKGYRSSTTITITTQELDKVPTIIQAAVDAGANQLQGLSFTVKDPEALIEQATDEAVENAKAKAQRVARRLGVTVAGVYRISVHDGGGSVIYTASADSGSAAAPMAKGASIPVFSGNAEFTASVSVVFEIK